MDNNKCNNLDKEYNINCILSDLMSDFFSSIDFENIKLQLFKEMDKNSTVIVDNQKIGHHC